MGRRHRPRASQEKICHFEDSEGKCWKPERRGVCRAPATGAAALVQHADFDDICRRDFPYGMRALCAGKEAQETRRMLASLRDPAVCRYRTCALVGAGGSLLGARLGKEIDSHDAVLRLNLAPDGYQAGRLKTAPHSHQETWLADVGGRTTWRLMAMEGYGYLMHYPRFWLARQNGRPNMGRPNMSGIPQEPLLAVACAEPTRGSGRCRAQRLRQVFGHAESASYLVNPALLHEWRSRFFRSVLNQKILSTGMWAIAFASQLCGETHLYGFGNGSCLGLCYHFYDCGAGSKSGGASQQQFFRDPKASGGYHNFSYQAQVLHQLARTGEIVPHWGSCAPNLGGAPDEFARSRARRPRPRLRRPR